MTAAGARRIGTGLVVLATFLASAPVALAHGGLKHVMGTVKEIAGDHLVVETREGKIRTVPVTKDTVYEQQGASAQRSDLRVGDRVVVHFTKSADQEVAKLIRFARPKVAENPVAPR